MADIVEISGAEVRQLSGAGAEKPVLINSGAGAISYQGQREDKL